MTTNDDLAERIAALDERLVGHIARDAEQWARAFPGGDADGHRKAHEAMIEAAQAEARFWSELRLDLAKKGLWGLIVLVVGLAMVGGIGMVASKLGLAAPIIK